MKTKKISTKKGKGETLPSPETTATVQPLEATPALAQEDSILDRFAEAIEQGGVTGEVHVAKLLYLALTSRFLPRPISLVVKGPSAGGKSFLTEQVLKFFPPRAFFSLTGMSERLLAYTEEPLQHRILVIFEAVALRSEFANYLVRSLLSEGKVRYGTVESTKEGLKPKVIEHEGPTGLIVTTTAFHLHPENETRMLSVSVTDTPQQTKSVMLILAEERATDDVDLVAWHELQEWLGENEYSVRIPYARTLAELIPPVAVRLRRDFTMITHLIKTHAILHQANRECGEGGDLIATLDDYEVIRDLMADLLAIELEAIVPQTVRETVEAVKELSPKYHASGVTVKLVAEKLGLDKSSTLRRVNAARDLGYLVNQEERRGRPAKLETGEPLPEERELLPTVEELKAGCRVAPNSGEGDPPTPDREE